MPTKEPYAPRPLTHKPVFDRQPGETDEAWQAFLLYRDPPAGTSERRTLQAVSRELSKSDQLIRQWSARWQWTTRNVAKDQHDEAVKRKASDKALAEMADRHARNAQVIQSALVQLPAEFLRRLKADPKFVQGIKDPDLIKAIGSMGATLKATTDVERLARGAETERVAVTGGLSIETLRAAWRRARTTTPAAGAAGGDAPAGDEASADPAPAPA